MMGDAEKCLSAGCSAFRTKPVDTDVMLRTLAEALNLEDRERALQSKAVVAAYVPGSAAEEFVQPNCR